MGMKYLLILAVGVALGFYLDRRYPDLPLGTHSVVQGPEPAAQDKLDERLRQWRLTPDDIKQDLARTGEIIRTQARVVSGKMTDARIVAVVKAKFVLDRNLAASDIHVTSVDGQVTLAGSVGSPELLGRAIALALDTDGVASVDSKLGVAEA
jgi:hypothetical protein